MSVHRRARGGSRRWRATARAARRRGDARRARRRSSAGISGRRRRSTRCARRSSRSTARSGRGRQGAVGARVAPSKRRVGRDASELAASGTRRIARTRSARPHPWRRRVPARAPAPGDAHLARARGRLRRPRLQGRRGPRGRARLVQLRSAELPARPSRPRDAGHALREARRAGAGAAAHAHVAGAGAHDGGAAAADLRRRAGPRVPARHARRAALAGVPPDRRARGRRGHHARRPARHDRGVRPRAVRAEHQRAVPPVVLPVHRAVGRVRDDVCVLRGRGLHRVLADGLGRARRRGHGRPRTCSRRSASTPSATPASRSGSASTASRSCSTASTTSRTSGTATSASSGSSEDRGRACAHARTALLDP